jgi:hypothetical protein
MGLFNTTVPTRFLVTMGHLIATIMVFYTKGDNIRVGLPVSFTAPQFNDANRR